MAVIGLLRFVLSLAVWLSYIYLIVVVPIFAMYRKSKMGKLLGEILARDQDERKLVDFATRYWNIITTCSVVAALIAAAIAFLSHDPIGVAIGGTWANVIALVIMIIGQQILYALFILAPLARLQKEDPEAYDAAVLLCTLSAAK